MSNKKLSTSKGPVIDLPTKDEQIRLRETRNLMSIGLLQLQMEEMLGEVNNKNSNKKHESNIRKWSESLIEIINSISYDNITITPTWLNEQGITSLQFKDLQTSITFNKPTNITTIGSYSNHLSTNPFLNIDIAIELPTEILIERDILNHSYFDKRNLYLGVIYSYLSNQDELFKEINFTYLKCDQRKPIITIKPNIKTPYTVRILIAAPEQSFKLSQLRPTRNNVRPDWWIETLIKKRNDSNQESEQLDPNLLTPTSHYNMAILEDVMMISIHEFINNSLEKSPFLRDVILVAKIWLTQKGFRWGVDSLDGHCVILLLIYLNSIGIIIPHTTVLTGFMAFLKFLVDLDNRSNICFSYDKRSSSGMFPIELYLPIHGKNDSTIYNVLWRLTKSSIEQLKEQAKLSLRTLQTPLGSDTTIATTAFNSVFLLKSDSHREYDMIVYLPYFLQSDIKNYEQYSSNNESLNSKKYQDSLTALDNLTPWQYESEYARNIITKALGDRVLKVQVLNYPIFPKESDISSSFYPIHSSNNSEVLNQIYIPIGLVLNSANMYRRVDRGPPTTDEVACAKFKSFWGQKSEMRRFKDGSIIEAVVWTDNDLELKKNTRPEHLIATIIKYILNLQMPLQTHLLGRSIVIISDQISSLLPEISQQLPRVAQTSISPETFISYSTKALFRRPIESIDLFRRIVTSELKGFPLVIENIRAISPSLRYTSLFPPIANPIIFNSNLLNSFSGNKVNTVVQVIPVVTELQKTSKWPNSLEALRSLKSALLIKLAELLKTQFSIRSTIHSQYLDIYFEGYIFRLNICTDEELSLIYSSNSQGSIDIRHASTREKYSTEGSKFYKMMIINPQHHLSIHNLSSRYDSYSETVRLFSLWIHYQNFSGYLESELIELIVASVYLSVLGQLPTKPPQSSTSGFLKSLFRLAEFDWRNVPLAVDLTLTDETEIFVQTDFDFIHSEFTSLRKLPTGGPALAIAGKYDRNEGFNFAYGMTFYDQGLWNLLINKAKETTQKIIGWMEKDVFTTLDSNSLYLLQTQSPEYDVTLTLIKSATTPDPTNYDSLILGPKQSQIEIFQNLDSEELLQQIVAREESGPHPLQLKFVQQLRKKYHHLALFFFNQLEGNQVGVIWKPDAFFPQNFTVATSLHQTISATQAVGVVNIATVISDLIVMGEGLVDDIIIK